MIKTIEPNDKPSFIGREVSVYRNLRNQMFSVLDRHSGLLVAHVSWISLRDVSFHVSERSRQRVIEAGQKNVHAKAKGVVVDFGYSRPPEWDRLESLGLVRVSYDPYKYGYFYNTDDQSRVELAQKALFWDGSIWLV